MTSVKSETLKEDSPPKPKNQNSTLKVQDVNDKGNYSLLLSIDPLFKFHNIKDKELCSYALHVLPQHSKLLIATKYLKEKKYLIPRQLMWKFQSTTH